MRVHAVFMRSEPREASFVERPIVLLTGVGRRGQVGEAVARAFASRGDRVIIVDRNEQSARERAEELRQDGFEVAAYGCDLTDVPQLTSTAATIRQRHGDRLHAFVHLAGGFAMSGPVADSDPEIYHTQIAINLTTAYLASRAFLPLVRNAGGAIVYFASEAALPGAKTTGMAAYAAAKTAVVSLMRTISAEERQHGVRANAVAPAAIRTAENERSMGADVAYVERDDVARVVMYLCSADAGAVTGQVIQLRGSR